MNKRIIIVASIIVVLIILGGLLIFSHNTAKLDTEITFLGNGSIENGDSIDFVLKDAQGKPIADKNLSILFESNGKVEKYSIITDSQGKGSLVVKDENNGNYSITVNFDGDDKYNSCSATQKIILGKNGAESVNQTTSGSYSASSSSSSSSSGLNYDNELNVYYDSNGRISGGQADGMDINYARNNRPTINNGNLE